MIIVIILNINIFYNYFLIYDHCNNINLKLFLIILNYILWVVKIDLIYLKMILKILYSSMKKKKELSVSIPENDIEKLHYSIFRTTTLQKLKVEYKNKEKNIQELAIIFKDNWYKEKKCNPVYIIK